MSACRSRDPALETVSVDVPEAALEAYEAALSDRLRDRRLLPRRRDRRLAGRGRQAGRRAAKPDWPAALALAAMVTGVAAELRARRRRRPRAGWRAPTPRFPNSGSAGASPCAARICGGRRRRPDHADPGCRRWRLAPASTARPAAACARLERVARRRPRRILDLGTGSGILAMAAARLLHRPVLATDIEPWSVRVARRNAPTEPARAAGPVPAGGWLAPPRSCAAARPTTWCSPTSWPVRCA